MAQFIGFFFFSVAVIAEFLLTGAGEMTPESLNFIINHVFLPPQLPQCADDASGEGRSALLDFLHRTAVQYTRNLAPNALAASRWPAVVKMLLQFEHTNSRSADGFAEAVSKMADGGGK